MRADRRAAGGEAAEVGIGTLIVFIASVLVAAVAASVLINTSGLLQERGETTGQQAIQAVSGNLVLQGVWASRPSSTGNMQHLNLTVQLAPGSYDLDLGNTTIALTSNTTLRMLSYVNGAGAVDRFNATSVRDPDGSFTPANPVVSRGALVKVWINLNVNGMTLGPNSHLGVNLATPSGSALVADVMMPTTFGSDTVLQVR